MHALPLEGLTGRLVVDSLVHYLNFPGAAIVIVSMVVIALYLSTTFSFNTAQQWLAIRFAFALAWRDRVRNWRSAWAENGRSPGKEVRQSALPRKKPPASSATAGGGRREDPASRRSAFADASARRAGGQADATPQPHTPSLWDQMPRTSIPDREPEPMEDDTRLRSQRRPCSPVGGSGQRRRAGARPFR